MKVEYDFFESEARHRAKGGMRISIFIDNAVLEEFRARAYVPDFPIYRAVRIYFFR